MLSDAKAKALKPQTRPYRIADSNGLCLEVRPNAMKVWRYRYRYLGKPSIVTICEYLPCLLRSMQLIRRQIQFGYLAVRFLAISAHRIGHALPQDCDSINALR